MSLLSDIEANRRSPGTRCSVSAALEEMPASDADAFRAAMAGNRTTYTSAAIARTLQANKYRVDQQAVSRHRNGECACP